MFHGLVASANFKTTDVFKVSLFSLKELLFFTIVMNLRVCACGGSMACKRFFPKELLLILQLICDSNLRPTLEECIIE